MGNPHFLYSFHSVIHVTRSSESKKYMEISPGIFLHLSALRHVRSSDSDFLPCFSDSSESEKRGVTLSWEIYRLALFHCASESEKYMEISPEIPLQFSALLHARSFDSDFLPWFSDSSESEKCGVNLENMQIGPISLCQVNLRNMEISPEILLHFGALLHACSFDSNFLHLLCQQHVGLLQNL